MYDTVAIATDGSEAMTPAIEQGVDIADRYDATVHAIAVVDRRLYVAADDDTRPDVRASLTEEAESAVEAVAAEAGDRSRQVETFVADGVPHSEIVSYADDEAVDLLVVGTHGRTGRDRHVNLGSVSERVVEAATCPVLVVHIDGEVS